ncbi:hypothetical protein DPEC_G00108740 [Dallia pectoralis]|uniref:Uncharacterized protein n=1 Tax=Dallia pectoralis TaxID=75939 RepID=A0ACC2GSE4_DALPE|nr:hypothetical protein DPEC_G00108740 [Dallia pectoralis]
MGADLMSRGGPRDDALASEPGDRLPIWERFGKARRTFGAENAAVACGFLRAQGRSSLGTDAFVTQLAHGFPLRFSPTVMPVRDIAGAVKADHLTVIAVARSSGGAMVSGNDSIVGCGAVGHFLAGTLYPRLWELSSAARGIFGP